MGITPVAVNAHQILLTRKMVHKTLCYSEGDTKAFLVIHFPFLTALFV